MSQVFWVLRHKTEPSLSSPKRTIAMKIKRPRTHQTKFLIFVALRTSSNGHLIHDTVSDMEYMLEYHEIYFDSVMEIIEQSSEFFARNILTLDDPTSTDIDIIVKISDHNVDAFRRIALDVYTIELRENQREPIPSEKDDICPICCEEFGTEGEINSLKGLNHFLIVGNRDGDGG
ncbi:unnamed protein product [Eruca vesicaria subsp. sativa]|uniref:Uncharacterized protein n=1 Tax=Eruca vesicaria subsp. sativa TaxID=29727 RepID=A0ABC8KG56_ERUVS|nr:unnamed protein product [Eruca vesicaria subsp. sativa]